MSLQKEISYYLFFIQINKDREAEKPESNFKLASNENWCSKRRYIRSVLSAAQFKDIVLTITFAMV